MIDKVAVWPIPPVRDMSLSYRQRARQGAAQLVVRNGGSAKDLRRLLPQLALWPTQDPSQ